MTLATEQIKTHLARQFHLPEDQIESMLPSFIATLDSHLANLRAALEGADPLAIGKAGHTIKGAFLNLGLADCADIALAIEQEGKAGNSDADFFGMVEQLEERLAPVFSHPQE